MNTFKKKSALAILIGIYTILLLIIYKESVVPYWAYYGFRYLSRPLNEVFIIWFLMLLPVSILPIEIKRPSTIVGWGLYLTVYIPILMVTFFSLKQPTENFFAFFLVLFICLFLISLTDKLPLIPVKVFSLSQITFLLLVLFLMAVLHIQLFFLFRKISIPSLFNVYELRLPAREILGASKLSYAISALGYAIHPFLIALGLVSGRWWLFILGSLGEIVLFGYDGLKSYFFVPIFLLVFYFITVKMKKLTPFMIISLFLALISFAFVIDLLIPGLQYPLSSLFTRRLVFAAGLLSSVYYDFFSSHPFMMWKYTLIGRFLENVLGISTHNPYLSFSGPGTVIGKLYFGSPTTNANANLWADGFANFGYIGMIVETIIAIGYFWIFDSISLRKDMRLAYLMILPPFYTFSDTGVLTALLTDGALLTLLLLFILPSTHTKKGVKY
jgi:hypothetical protein